MLDKKKQHQQDVCPLHHPSWCGGCNSISLVHNACPMLVSDRPTDCPHTWQLLNDIQHTLLSRDHVVVDDDEIMLCSWWTYCHSIYEYVHNRDSQSIHPRGQMIISNTLAEELPTATAVQTDMPPHHLIVIIFQRRQSERHRRRGCVLKLNFRFINPIKPHLLFRISSFLARSQASWMDSGARVRRWTILQLFCDPHITHESLQKFVQPSQPAARSLDLSDEEIRRAKAEHHLHILPVDTDSHNQIQRQCWWRWEAL